MIGDPFGAHDAAAARARLRERLAAGETLQVIGAFSPLVARLIEDVGFDAAYVSGAVLSTDLALPDVGMTTMSEVVARSGAIARATALPTLVDADTGFGEPLSMARTIRELEAAGVAGCHVEDQVNPKRCGHLDGKQLVGVEEMARKLAAAVAARRDPNFLLIARTDARAVEGLAGAIDRARAYVAAGADAIFCEAFTTLEEYRAMRSAVDVPLLANMTEFGKTPLYPLDDLRDAGVALVLYPVTTWRLALGAVERGLRSLRSEGTQAAVLPEMQSRARLYELVRYEAFGQWDAAIADHGYGEPRHDG
jgi:methylisocitrate lyase